MNRRQKRRVRGLRKSRFVGIGDSVKTRGKRPARGTIIGWDLRGKRLVHYVLLEKK